MENCITQQESVIRMSVRSYQDTPGIRVIALSTKSLDLLLISIESVSLEKGFFFDIYILSTSLRMNTEKAQNDEMTSQ